METTSILLTAATSIGDKLLETAIPKNDQLYWNFYSLNDHVIAYGEQSSLYKGTCGVIYYLASLYNVTAKRTYLDAAIAASRYIESYHAENGFQSPALLAGSMSVSITFLQLFEITGEVEFREKAIFYAKASKNFLQFPISDYVNGIGGTILGLLKVYVVTGDVDVAAILYQFVCELIDRIIIHTQGFYWEISPDHIKGLCGFSHGASGYAATFLELYAVFNNPAFLWIADQAILYENQHFSIEQGNWMDFRIPFNQRKQQEEVTAVYKNGQLKSFLQPGFMNTWCHGAAGIALTRLRAYELTNNKKYLPDLEVCLRKIVEGSSGTHSPLTSYTLCHGHLGNMDVLLEANRVLKTEKYSPTLYSVSQRAIQENERKGFYSCGINTEIEDIGLFLGNAGIGHFYLRLFDRNKTPTLLYMYASLQKEPAPSQTGQRFQHITAGHVLERVFKKHFPVTHTVLQHANNFDKETFYNRLAAKKMTLAALKKNFTKYIAPLINNKPYLNGLFQLELTCAAAYTTTQSHALLYTKEQLKYSFKHRVHEQGMPDDDIELVTDPAIIYLFSKIQYPSSEEGMANSFLQMKRKYGILPIFQRSFIYEINPLSDHILTYFKTPLTIRKMLSLFFADGLATYSPDTETIIKQQIKHLIIAGLLLLADDHINSLKNLNN